MSKISAAIDVHAAIDYFTVIFGPDNKYQLHIPVSATTKKLTAENLFFCGAKILNKIVNENDTRK